MLSPLPSQSLHLSLIFPSFYFHSVYWFPLASHLPSLQRDGLQTSVNFCFLLLDTSITHMYLLRKSGNYISTTTMAELLRIWVGFLYVNSRYYTITKVDIHPFTIQDNHIAVY